MERDGEGALYSSPEVARSVWIGERNPHTGVGATWSFVDVKLCLTAPGLRPVVRSLEPASVEGQVRVEPIVVGTAALPPPRGSEPPERYLKMYERMHIIGATRRIPRGLHDPNGWVVRHDCRYGHWHPVTEIVVTMTKTGPEGGGIDGIVVTYRWDGRLHRYTIAVSFGICGTATRDHCWGGEDVTGTGTPRRPGDGPWLTAGTRGRLGLPARASAARRRLQGRSSLPPRPAVSLGPWPSGRSTGGSHRYRLTGEIAWPSSRRCAAGTGSTSCTCSARPPGCSRGTGSPRTSTSRTSRDRDPTSSASPRRSPASSVRTGSTSSTSAPPRLCSLSRWCGPGGSCTDGPSSGRTRSSSPSPGATGTRWCGFGGGRRGGREGRVMVFRARGRGVPRGARDRRRWTRRPAGNVRMIADFREEGHHTPR